MIRRLGKGLVMSLLMGSHQAWASCWEDVARRYDIEPELLQAIAVVESGARAGAMNQGNSDGSRDIGLMQINSMHLPRLAKQGITEERLLAEPCLSVEVGASILADFSSASVTTGQPWVPIMPGQHQGARHCACVMPKKSGRIMRRWLHIARDDWAARLAPGVPPRL